MAEVFGLAADGETYFINGSYATVTTTTTGAASSDAGTHLTAGQDNQYAGYQSFLAFDLSAVPNVAAATAAVLSLYGFGSAGAGFTVEARTFDWGATVDTGDYLTSAEFGACTLLASQAIASLGTGAYFNFTSAAGLLTAVQAGGTLRMILCSDKYRTATQPAGGEYWQYKSADDTNKPKLTITLPGGMQMLL